MAEKCGIAKTAWMWVTQGQTATGPLGTFDTDAPDSRLEPGVMTTAWLPTSCASTGKAVHGTVPKTRPSDERSEVT